MNSFILNAMIAGSGVNEDSGGIGDFSRTSLCTVEDRGHIQEIAARGDEEMR